jgi:hypothetical protein
MNAFAHNAFSRRSAFASAFGSAVGGGGLPFPVITSGSLILRLLGSNITGVADGGAVQTWTDTSGLAHDATQGTLAARPEFILASANFNGQPTVAFDGVDDGMLVDDGCALNTPYTLFLVAKALHGEVGNARYLQSQDGNHKISFNTTEYSCFSNPATIQNTSTVEPGAAAAIACLVSGVAENHYYINTDTSYNNFFALGNWGRLALNGAGAFGEYIAQETAAVIAFDGALDDTDRLAVSAYLDTLYFGGLLGFA